MKKCVNTLLNLEKLLLFSLKFLVIEYLLLGRAGQLKDVILAGNFMKLISQQKTKKLHVSSK